MNNEKTKVQNVDKIVKEYNKQKKDQKYYLIIISGENIGKIYSVEGQKTVIGRVHNCDVSILDSSISREHAFIDFDIRGVPTIKDLDSTNGTFVNGEKVSSIELKDGDKIQCGTSTVFKFSKQDTLETEYHVNLYESAIKDPLTGVFNKRYFLERLNREFVHALRHFQQLALIMIDIDFFKKVNDTYGHPAGDEVIKVTADRIEENLRAGDVLCRYGGEEFAVIIRDCNKGNLLYLAERIREIFDGRAIKYNDKMMKVTVSMGIAISSDENIADPEDLIAEADKNLYRAKKDGRNCIRSS